jgi:hypothetical protein
MRSLRPLALRPFARAAILFSALLALGACGDDDDAPPPAPDAGAPDLGPQPSTLFGPCVVDSQCPGEGAVCRRGVDGFPKGMCTRPCLDRTQCDDGITYHHCLPDGSGDTFCAQRCLNGLDCGRNAYTCEGEYPPSGGRCIGICGSDADCGADAECDEASGRCVAVGTPPRSGGSYGASCDGDADCATGLCLGGPGSSLEGGYCVSYCILPAGYNSNDLFAGDTLPSGACGDDAVCFPAINTQAEGDLGACFDGCQTNADCRVGEGYECRRTFGLSSGDSKTFMNGVCLPAG